MTVITAILFALRIKAMFDKSWPFFIRHIWPLRCYLPHDFRQKVKKLSKLVLPAATRHKLRQSEASVVLESKDGTHTVLLKGKRAFLLAEDGDLVELFPR